MEQRFSHHGGLFRDALARGNVIDHTHFSNGIMENDIRVRDDIRPIEELISSSLFADERHEARPYSPILQTPGLPEPHVSEIPALIPEQSFMASQKAFQIRKGSGHATSHRSEHLTLLGRQAQKPKRSRAFFWTLLGFILGVLFWHTVGFWNFVNGTLLTEPHSTRLGKEILEEKKVNTTLPPEEESAVMTTPADHVACVDLVMDRARNETVPKACDPGKAFTYAETTFGKVARLDSGN